MKLALICPAVTGHLNPMLQVGKEFQRRGHDVTVVALVDAQDRVEQRGLKFAAFGEAEFPRGAVLEMSRRLGELKHAAALDFTIDHYRREATSLLADFRGLQDQQQFDAIITDQTMPGGTAADLVDLPFITLCNALPLNPEPTVPPWSTPWDYDASPQGIARNERGYQISATMVRPVLDAVNEFRREAGLTPFAPPTSRQRDGDSPLAIISQQPPSFDFPRTELPSHFHYAGPFFDADEASSIAFPWERLDDRPLIYASMGTLQNGLEWIFSTIAAAVAELPVQLVMSLGRTDAVPPLDLPGNPLVVPYAPQSLMLRRASLAITHAGMNTVLEALSCGVPMVAIPIANDQPANAARVVWSCAGQVVPLEDLSAGTLREAIRRVLENTEFQKNAQKIQAEICGLGGARRAVDIIEVALSERRTGLGSAN